MLVASASLARRIEAAERRLAVGLAETVRGAGEDAFMLPLAGGVAVYAGEGSPCNKVIGAGFDDAIDLAALAAIEDAYSGRSAPVQVELSSLADPALASTLTRRGYVLVGFEDVLGRALDPSLAPPAGEIAVEAADDTGVWIRVVSEGFARPDLGAEGGHTHESFSQAALERIFLRFTAAPGFRRYFARCGGALAGGGSVRLDDGLAQLCGASTLPEFRRRGVQTALLQARLADAARAGCDLATVTTTPGSKSQHNARRQGFELLYTRAILVKPP